MMGVLVSRAVSSLVVGDKVLTDAGWLPVTEVRHDFESGSGSPYAVVINEAITFDYHDLVTVRL